MKKTYYMNIDGDLYECEGTLSQKVVTGTHSLWTGNEYEKEDKGNRKQRRKENAVKRKS